MQNYFTYCDFFIFTSIDCFMILHYMLAKQNIDHFNEYLIIIQTM